MGRFMLGLTIVLLSMQDGIAFNEECIPERPIRLGEMMEEPRDLRPGSRRKSISTHISRTAGRFCSPITDRRIFISREPFPVGDAQTGQCRRALRCLVLAVNKFPDLGDDD